MIVYSGTKSQFHSDVMSNGIGNIISGAYSGATSRRPTFPTDAIDILPDIAGALRLKACSDN